MSTTTNLNHNVIYLKDSMTLEQKQKELFELFDEDDNGNNGDDYLDTDAEDKGFTNNAEWIIAQHTTAAGELELEEIAQKSRTHDCYFNVKVEIVNVPDGKVLIVLALFKW